MTTKIPAELSSTPGISDSSNATAITIDSSENVGIGATSSSTRVTIQAADSDTVNSSANGHLTFYDDAPFGYYKIRIATTNRDLAFDGYDTDNSWKEILKLDRVDQRINAKGGIMFGSDTAAANTLDDYEEGTFTVVVSSGITSVGYSVQDGYYTKIGNLIMFNIRVVTTSGNAQSSTFALDNLPLNAAVGQPGGFAVRAYSSSFSSSDNQIFINPNDNTLSFYKLDGTAFLGTDITDHDGFDLRISGVYRAV